MTFQQIVEILAVCNGELETLKNEPEFQKLEADQELGQALQAIQSISKVATVFMQINDIAKIVRENEGF